MIMNKKQLKEFNRLKAEGEAQIKEGDFKAVVITIDSLLSLLKESNENGKDGSLRR